QERQDLPERAAGLVARRGGRVGVSQGGVVHDERGRRGRLDDPVPLLGGGGGGVRGGRPFAAVVREELVGVVEVVHRQPDLLEVVARLHAGGGLAHLLHCGQQQADQDGNDGNHHQQFDEREGGSPNLL